MELNDQHGDESNLYSIAKPVCDLTDSEGWDGEGGGRVDQDGECM